MTTNSTTCCAIPGRPHPATDGMLCRGHLESLGRMLRDVEDEAIQLETRPSMAISYNSSGGGLASQQAPIRLDARALRDRRRGTGITRDYDFDVTGWDDTASVLETLHSWARLVRQERRITAPAVTVVLHRWTATPPGPACWHPPLRPCNHASCTAAGRPVGLAVTDTHPASPTVTGERDLLTRQLDWITQQPWVDEFYAAIQELLTQLRRTNNTLVTHVGTCGSLQPDGALCAGKVWHVVIKPDGKTAPATAPPGPDDEPGFRCGTCRRIWTGTDAVRKRNDMWIEEQTREGAQA